MQRHVSNKHGNPTGNPVFNPAFSVQTLQKNVSGFASCTIYLYGNWLDRAKRSQKPTLQVFSRRGRLTLY